MLIPSFCLKVVNENEPFKKDLKLVSQVCDVYGD